MGAYAPVPWFGQPELERAAAEIFEPIAWRMARDGTPYRGVLYAGLMITEHGPMVLEFNVRFGDPEAEVILPLLNGDLAQALLGVATNDIGQSKDAVVLRAGAAVGVVVAAPGYPESPAEGREIDNVEPSGPGDDGELLCFHAGTRRTADGGYQTAAGRAVTVVGRGVDLPGARATAYRGVAAVRLGGMQHRSDIGLREVAE